MRAEVAAPGLSRQSRELLAFHADQRGVIAAFHVDMPPRIDAVNEHDDQPRFLTMIGLVALVVAVVILVFFGIGYLFGRVFL